MTAPSPTTAPPVAPDGDRAIGRKALRRRRRRRRLRRAGLALLGLVLAAAIVGVVPPLREGALRLTSRVILFVARPFAPDITALSRFPQGSTVKAADGSVLARLDSGERRDPVTLDSLPPYVSQAVLAAEDERFYHHSGVDPGGVVRAVFRNASGGSVQGGSTITQQLAKLNYTDRRRTVFRKLREVLYASKLEERYSKDQLLERYLNQVYFGDGAYGIDAGAEDYFGVHAAQLTPAQAAMLAGKIRAPEGLDPRDPAKVEAVVVRRRQVLDNMVRNHWISAEGARAADASPLGVVPEPPASASATAAPHFVEFVKREAAGIDALGPTPAVRSTQLFTGGYTIETTLDNAAYKAASADVQRELGLPQDPAAAVVSVQPGDGAIRVLFGGLNFDRRQFDAASQGRRQPGSSFKPLVYLAMLQQGIDPRTRFDGSSPRTLTFDGQRFTVRNAETGEGGSMTVDTGLIESVNTVFAQLVLQVGPDKVVDEARALGITDPLQAVPSIALGAGGEVTPLEMAAAYATIAAKGVYAKPYSISRILDRDGHVVYERKATVKQAVDPTQAGVLTATLAQVVTNGTGTGAAIGRPVAGKTGTTEGFGDAWFVGFTPQLATAVWVGYPDAPRPMTNVHGRRVFGGTYPASIFAATMKAALADQPELPLATAAPDDLNLSRRTGPTVSSGRASTSRPSRPGPSPSTAGSSTTVPPASSSAPPSSTPSSTPPPTAPTTPPTTAPAPTTTKKPPGSSTTVPGP